MANTFLPSGTRHVVNPKDPWEMIPGYAVSADGKVYRWAVDEEKWKEMAIQMREGDRACVRLHHNGRARYLRVANLVLCAFAGPHPSGSLSFRFLDGDATNNRLENLRWFPLKNVPSRLNGGRKLGSARSQAKLNEADIPRIRSMYRDRVPVPAIAKEFRVSEPTIYQILSGRIWKHVIGP